MVRISKPKTFQAYLDDCHRRYSCAHCRAHLANHDDLISKVSRPHMSLEWQWAAWQLPIDSPNPFLSSPTTLQSFQGSQGRAYLFNSV